MRDSHSSIFHAFSFGDRSRNESVTEKYRFMSRTHAAGRTDKGSRKVSRLKAVDPWFFVSSVSHRVPGCPWSMSEPNGVN